MHSISPPQQARFIAHLKGRMVLANTHLFYVRWLRYYLDFCEKYRFSHEQRASLQQFLLIKLQEKKQTPAQQQQAGHAISLCYELLRLRAPVGIACSPQRTITSNNSSAGSGLSAGLSSEPEPPPRESRRPMHSSVERSQSPAS